MYIVNFCSLWEACVRIFFFFALYLNVSVRSKYANFYIIQGGWIEVNFRQTKQSLLKKNAINLTVNVVNTFVK